MEVVGRALISALPEFQRLFPNITSTYHLGPFSGEPDNFTIYLSITSKDALREAEKSEVLEHAKPLLEGELRMNGYSIDAINTFSYEIVRQEDVDKAGGWHDFLR